MSDPTTSKCSRCGAEPRAGSSGWGRTCIRDKMRALRAAPGYTAPPRKRRSKVLVVNGQPAHGADESAEALRRSAAIEAARARMQAARAARAALAS